MGIFKFDNLPVNTLVGADNRTFDAVTGDKEIGGQYKRKYRLTKGVCRLMNIFYRINERKYAKMPELKDIDDPVFIIGHWRSGTTFVHNVISQDPKFCYCSTYQTVFPHLMLWGSPFFKWCMKVVMPSSRPTDSLELKPDQPQEEEFALTNMTPCSYYHFWMFPQHTAEYRDKYLLMNTLSKEEKEDFCRNMRKMIDTALYCSGKKQYLSKNPPHTSRISTLLEMYPNAKFIYLVRNPYTVYKSTMSFIKNTIQTLKLQDISEEDLEHEIVETYKQVYGKYESEKHLIPEGHLVEVRFEDFEKDPVGKAEEIYKAIDLGDFDNVKGYMLKYADSKKGHKKNKYQYDQKTIDTVNANWKEAVDEWGYGLE